MNPIGVAVFAALLLLVSIERSNSQTGFSYDRQDLWPDNCNVPTAMRQTPIDIITRDVQRNSSLKELEFNDVWTATLDGTFSNNGLTPRFVASTGGTATVRNHLGSYDLLTFHLHWGRENAHGASHKRRSIRTHFVTLLQGEARDAQPLNGRIVSVLPSSVALDLVFTNDTPQVNGSGILHADFATNTPGTDIFLTCRLEGPSGTITQDCKHACCI